MEFPSLYEKTGSILDINTMLVPRRVMTSKVAWYESMAELAAIYGEMCHINETPTKDQTIEQKERLRVLRKECVDVHYRRIVLNEKRSAT